MASFRTASTRLKSISAEDRKTLARFQKHFASDVEKVLLKNVEKLEALCTSYSAENRNVFPAGRRDAVRKIVERQATDQLSLRNRSLAEAKKYGINLKRLKKLQDRFHRQFDQLLDGGNSFSSGSIIVRAPKAPFDWPPPVLPTDPDTGIYIPPFGEGWERRDISNATGAGRVTENRSYLDAQWGRIGSRLVAHNHDASDHDEIMIYRQNGFIVPFTMPTTGVVEVSADLVCLLCRHGISTSDEWGWSDFHGFTRSTLVLSVFWSRDDPNELVSEIVIQSFVPGLDCRGDGESYPGMVVQVDSGQLRSVRFAPTDIAFPAGKTVWVYVGIADFVWAMLNDVSIDISLESAWHVSSLAILSV
jgi:hypothetical protein